MKQKLIFILSSLLINSSYTANVTPNANMASSLNTGSSSGSSSSTGSGMGYDLPPTGATTPPPITPHAPASDSEYNPSSLLSPRPKSSIAPNALESKPSYLKPTTDTATTPTLGKDKVVLNFENSDIATVVKAISQLSGKNFVVDPRVKGTITIVSNKPVTKADSYKILESALRMQGFATVEADGVIKVVPEIDAKTYGMKTVEGRVPTTKPKNSGDGMLTKVFVLQHGSATQMANALRPSITSNNSIAVYPGSNALVITDYASNLERLSSIIDKLVPPTSQQALIGPFNFAIAADIAQVLQSYLQGGSTTSSGGGGGGSSGGGGADGPNVSVTVQVATNSILLYSSSKEKLEELKNIALRMDKAVGDDNNLHVVYLKNADASHIADVLRVVVTGQENPDITATAISSKFTNEPSGVFAASGSGAAGGAGNLGNKAGTGATNRSTQGNNNANQKEQPKVFIQAEPTTNSLIIHAPFALYRNIRMIIDMLDVRRAQVMIEAMIADINATNKGTFGIQWVVGAGNGNGGVIGAANYGADSGNNGSSALSSIATTIMGASQALKGGGSGIAGGGAAGGGSIGSIPNEVYIGLVSGVTTVDGQTIPTLTTLADMLSATQSGNILSRPTLITLDNEEARIQVGSNIGIPNGSFTNTAGSANNMTTTVTRQDLGTFLQIKPKITQNGAIQLDIYQEDSKVDPSVLPSATNGPSFLKRTMRSTILLDDGQIIALGGMTQDTVSLQQNGIPILSSIPYLGWLFSWQSRSHTKTNLVLFLRPVIIRNAEGYKALTNQRYQYVMDQQNLIKASGNLLLPEIKPVTLDNQVPYDNLVPAQKDKNLVTTPLVDVRETVINKKTAPAAAIPTTPVAASNNVATTITPRESSPKESSATSTGITR